jgi:hypothetical protein
MNTNSHNRKHQAIHDAAERIFSHAIEWNEGRKKWDGETVEHIIRYELEKAELAERNNSIGKRIWRFILRSRREAANAL